MEQQTAMHQAPPPSHPALQDRSSGWTRRQDKLLELLLCGGTSMRWDRIAVHLGGDKTPEQARRRYESMVAELRRVLEAPRVDTPPEWDLNLRQAAAADAPTSTVGISNKVMVTGVGVVAPPRTGGRQEDVIGALADGQGEEETAGLPACNSMAEVSVEGRNRAVPWSPEEHRLFLAGIREHGTGKWQKLSREFVTTRNPSQIASHYQKYTIRQAKLRRNECKRPSIHDINDDDNTPRAADGHGDDGKPATAGGEATNGTANDDESAGYDLHTC